MGRKAKSSGLNTPFRKLSGVVAATKTGKPPFKQAGRPREEKSDDSVFLEAMRGVQPLERTNTRVEPEKRERPRTDDDDTAVMRELEALVRGGGEFRIDETGEFQYGLAPGVNNRILQQLKTGAYSFRRHLDLHGHTREEAHRALIDFVNAAYLAEERCVLVVTGRGKRSPGGVSVLRETIGRWLSRAPLGPKVLAFCTARSVDGGPGAFYVLLRRLGKG